MIPSTVLQLAETALLAADTATLAAATALHVHLAKAAFVPTPGLDPATLVEADFVGYAAIAIVTGAQLHFIDPVTGLRTIELKEPAGGLHFATTGITNLPQTIFGWWVTDDTDVVLYGSGLLPVPIPLAISGQGFDLPPMRFAFLNNSPN